jgi:S-formylglutathione hydrolase
MPTKPATPAKQLLGRSLRLVLLLLCAAPALWTVPLFGQARLVEGALDSDLVPSPVPYYALLPPGYQADGDPVPLVLNLHGGGGSRDVLKRQQPMFERLWASGELPPMVIVTPSVAERCFYMDFKDGSQKWEQFLVGPFLAHLRERFEVRTDRRGTLVTGISMGGMGSLRLAFKHPELFGAVAAMEPGIAPVDDWQAMRDKHRFWRADELMESIYGKPVDGAFWNANNPATLAQRDAAKLRDSGLRIFLEAGDADLFWLYEGAEFLHQVLWQQRIRHEYRLYYDADHVGRTLGPRTEAAYSFLASTLEDPPSDPVVQGARRRIDPLKRRLDEADHYGVDQELVRPPPR